MKKFELAKSGVDVSGAILGLMRIDALQDDQIRSLCEAARQSGINVFDHADIYGGKPHLTARAFSVVAQPCSPL